MGHAAMTAQDREILVNPGDLAESLDALRRVGRHGYASTARRLVLLALGHLCPETGLIQLNRRELAERLGVAPEAISFAMTTLENLGVIRRERRPEPGRRGSGTVLAFLNPHLAWSGTADARARWLQQVEPPSARRHRTPEISR